MPLIAETGGINAMIVDATALPEQVADDVVTSAFRSAGQRCSALRLLFVQDDVADRMIEMIAGAARELVHRRSRRSRHPYRPGDRRRGQAAAGCAYRAHEEGSAGAFRRHRARRQLRRAAHFRTVRCRPARRRKCSARSCTWCATAPTGSTQVLQIDRTLGLRPDARHPFPDRRHGRGRRSSGCQVGNIYVNRNMIGAVVGVQPFGGHGLSGTGPKAGGPHYLRALRHRTDGDRQYRRGRRQCSAAVGRGVVASPRQDGPNGV